MSWVKIDDQFFRHPKVMAAGRDARDLYLVGLTYCAQASKDGYIPARVIPRLSAEAEIDDAPASVARLVDLGLWDEIRGNFWMTDVIRWGFGSEPSDQELRHTPEYKAWRKAVLDRDGYRCRECGTTDRPLQAHHIKAFALYPEHRFEVQNGITLCVDCHSETHGRRLG